MNIEEDEIRKRTYLVSDSGQKLVYWVWSHYGRQGAWQEAWRAKHVISGSLRNTEDE